MKTRKVMNRVVVAPATSAVDCWFQLGTWTQLKMLLSGALTIQDSAICFKLLLLCCQVH
jgi:hypothetical protein